MSEFENTINSIVDAMSVEEHRKLIQFIDPLTDEQEEEFSKMTDEELLDKLFS